MVRSRESSKRWLKPICRSQEGFFCGAEGPTWTESVKDLCHFRNVCKSFCINVPPLSQLCRIIARKLEWRVAAQCTPPVVQQNREGELPLLDLIANDVVDFVLNDLWMVSICEVEKKTCTYCAVFRPHVPFCALVDVFKIPKDDVEGEE